MAFHLVDLQTWPRRTHYEAYRTALPLDWNLTSRIEITRLLDEVHARGLRFYPAVLYAALTAVNDVPAFKMGYDAAGRLGYFDEVHPSYTIFHPQDQTFSDIWSPYSRDFPTFYRGVTRDMEAYRDVHGYSVKPGRPANCAPVSMVPWLSFDSCAFSTVPGGRMLQPVLTFGQYTRADGKTKIPLSVFASHAAADGWHAAQLFHRIGALAARPEDWLGGVAPQAEDTVW